jgi:hypothetical protein
LKGKADGMVLAELSESFPSSFVLFSPIRPIFTSPISVTSVTLWSIPPFFGDFLPMEPMEPMVHFAPEPHHAKIATL